MPHAALVQQVDANGNSPTFPTGGGGQTISPVQGTLTDKSGTITSGSTSQVASAVNANRKYLLLENPTTASEPLYFNFTTAASTSASGSYSLAPGGSFVMETTFITTEAVNVTATTTGHAFVCKEA